MPQYQPTHYENDWDSALPHKSIKYKIKIPMIENKRSLNLATSVAIIIAESLRQTLILK